MPRAKKRRARPFIGWKVQNQPKKARPHRRHKVCLPCQAATAARGPWRPGLRLTKWKFLLPGSTKWEMTPAAHTSADKARTAIRRELGRKRLPQGLKVTRVREEGDE